MPGISAQEITRRGRLLQTGQTTTYFVGDDGDHEAGLDKAYYVLTVGGYAGTTDIQVAHYAAATISFAAPNTIADAAGGLAGWAVNDRMLIKGSTGNDGEVTVTGIGGAPANLTISAAVNELAGAVISLYKVAAHSNNCVFDRRTGLMWSRYTSNGEAVGPNSNGTLNWYDVATVFTLHGAAADLQMIAPDTLRIVGGAAELTAYHEGDLLECTGFANPDPNDLPGYYVEAVAVNGADLDITLDPSNQTLVSEAAGGARSIGLVCQSTFNYAAGARLGTLAEYADWRPPDIYALFSISDFEAAGGGYPDAVAFPGWPRRVWSATTAAGNATLGLNTDHNQTTGSGADAANTKTLFDSRAAIIRGQP